MLIAAGYQLAMIAAATESLLSQGILITCIDGKFIILCFYHIFRLTGVNSVIYHNQQKQNYNDGAPNAVAQIRNESPAWIMRRLFR